MKNVKRILAVLAIIFLVGLYISTLVFALMKSPAAYDLFKASIVCTVIIPILLYAYVLIYKLIKNKENK
jgi:hypothetical protein